MAAVVEGRRRRVLAPSRACRQSGNPFQLKPTTVQRTEGYGRPAAVVANCNIHVTDSNAALRRAVDASDRSTTRNDVGEAG
eukprot:6212039-Pleurochrysis_carterae.AAC.5